MFLDRRNLLGPQFDPKISPGHHNSVRLLKYFIQIFYGFRFFDLCDDRDIGALSFYNCLDLHKVFCTSNKWQGEIVDTDFYAKIDISFILLGQRRGWNRHTGKIDSLFFLQYAAVYDPAFNGIFWLRQYPQFNEPVINQYFIALFYISRKIFIGCRHRIGCPNNFLRCNL